MSEYRHDQLFVAEAPIVKLLQARITFVVLQVLDLVTTLAAFRVGAFEVNPLVAHLTTLLGPVGGVVCSKLIALALGWWVRKRLWIVNLFYAGIICWNVYVLLVLTHARR